MSGAQVSPDATRLFRAAGAGDAAAGAALLPLVYDELRRLAGQHLSNEPAGHTLQATALVHEAYLRLVDGGGRRFANRTHFFRAAAASMRRILIDHARHKLSLKAGGGRNRVTLASVDPAVNERGADLLALDEALQKLARTDPRKAELVTLRFFGGLSKDEAADALGISASTADNDWAYARAWLRVELDGLAGSPGE
jgi:RNA polymerase sigma factor (TIGR02999 family)